MGGQPFEQQVRHCVGLRIEHPVRPAQGLETVLAADVAPSVAGTLLSRAVSPSLHTYIVGTVIFSPTPRRSVSGIARYQLRPAVSTPGSAIARASQSAASADCLPICMNVDKLR